MPRGGGKSVDRFRRHPDKHVWRQTRALVRGVHSGQRADPDADTVCRAANQATYFASRKSSGKHSANVAPWVELPDCKDLLGDPVRSKGVLHQAYHRLL